MNNSLDLALEPLDHLEAPMTTGEGVVAVLIGFGVGVGIGVLIT